MTRLLTPHIATMTELREPHKVLERAGGKPVAILKNSAVVAYLVPAEACGHCFNDANKRTAFRVMNGVLALNGVAIPWQAHDVGPVIVRVAQGLMDEGALADWLRAKAG
jgi:death-on-curing family protein